MDPLVLIGGVVGLLILLIAMSYKAISLLPYVYGATRLRASRTRLMRKEELVTLTSQSYKSAILKLEEKGHSNLLDFIDSDFREELVQKRIRELYIKELKRIEAYTPDVHKKFFEILENREELEFLISVVRSKINPFYGRHIIKDLFLETRFMKNLNLEKLESMTLDEFLAYVKKSNYGMVVDKHCEDIKKGNITKFEQAINEKYYHDLKVAAKMNPVLKEVAERFIDIHNIYHAAYFTSEKHFLSEGKLNSKTLNQLQKVLEIKDLVAILEKTYLGDYVKNAKNINELLIALYVELKDYANQLLSQNPLGINQFVSYYIMKKIETKNIRTLLKLISVKFNPEEIKRYLI